MKRFLTLTFIGLALATRGAVTTSPSGAGSVAANGGAGTNNTFFNSTVVADPMMILVGFDNGASQGVQFKNYYSADGITFKRIGSAPIFTVDYAGGYRLRDGRFYLRSNVWYINSLLKFYDNRSVVLSSTNFANWRSNSTITCHASGVVWDTQFYDDPAGGGTHLLFSRSPNGTTDFQIYEKHVTDWASFPNDAAWSTAAVLTNAAGGAIWTNMIGPSIVYWNGAHNLFFKQEDQVNPATRYIAWAQSTNGIYGPYTLRGTNNWMGPGIGYGFEGNSPVLWNGVWRIYFDINGSTNTALQNSVFVECAAANFPDGPWTGPTVLQCADFLSNPGVMILTNATLQLQVLKAVAAGAAADQPLNVTHGGYHDFLIGPNFKISSKTYQTAWNRIEIIDTNQIAMSLYMDWDSGIWNFVKYDKTGGAYPVPFTISAAGANGTLNGTTVSASVGFVSTGSGIGTFNTNSAAPANATTPAVWFNITNGGQVFKVGGYK